MKRMLPLLVGVLLASAPVFAQSGAAKSAKTLSAGGTVSAVTDDSLTIKAKGTEWKFQVDKDTKISVKGATRTKAELKDEKKAPRVGDFVKVGDFVDVKYHDMGATKHAADVVVRASVPRGGKK
jgi:hypothetical protein